MLPKYHFIYGTIVSFVLYFGFDVGLLGCLVFLTATVCIDVDHYFYYVYVKRDWNLRKAFSWFNEERKYIMRIDSKDRKNFYYGFCVFHGIEVILLFALLGYFSWGIFYFVAFGIFFHLLLDHIEINIMKGRFDKFSIIYDYFKYSKLPFVEEAFGIEEMILDEVKK